MSMSSRVSSDGSVSGKRHDGHHQANPGPPSSSIHNIGDVLGQAGGAVPSPLLLNGSSPQPQNQHRPNGDGRSVKESNGIARGGGDGSHTLLGGPLNPLPVAVDDTPKLVATIFYKSHDPIHPRPHPRPQASSLTQLPEDNNINNNNLTNNLTPPTVAPGSAPTDDVAQLPREPPAQDQAPQPLDHLYGPYVTQLCRTSFLQVVEELCGAPGPASHQPPTSTYYRCLDDEERPRVVEVTVHPLPDQKKLLPVEDLRKHENVWRFEREWNVEVVMQRESVFRRHKRLAVFDMDSTLIQQEVIDEIARFIGVEKEVSEITTRAMNGELDFAASLKARVQLLKGVPADVFEKLKPRITISPGARELCRALKRLGVKLAVLSGGFQPLADWLAGELGLDYAFANHLEIDDATQTLTGALVPEYPIVDATQKRSLLRSLAAETGALPSQTLAVGDGANDLLMLAEAGLGVAWRAKSKVQLEAPARLNGESLVDVLYLLGFGAGEVSELLA